MRSITEQITDELSEEKAAERRFMEVWNAKPFLTPVIVRSAEMGTKLLVRLPYGADNRDWLRNQRRYKPEWVPAKKHWELPKAWFNQLVDRILARFGSVFVVQPYNRHEVCAPACRKARGHICQCSCLGKNHGSLESEGWFDVHETFSVRWDRTEFGVRLLTTKSTSADRQKPPARRRRDKAKPAEQPEQTKPRPARRDDDWLYGI